MPLSSIKINSTNNRIRVNLYIYTQHPLYMFYENIHDIAINIIEWRLPSNPFRNRNSLIYHPKYGLLSIDGDSSFILNLNAANNHKDLKWKQVKTGNGDDILPAYNRRNEIGFDNTLLLNNDKSKLFVIGGFVRGPQKWLKMVDFNHDDQTIFWMNWQI